MVSNDLILESTVTIAMEMFFIHPLNEGYQCFIIAYRFITALISCMDIHLFYKIRNNYFDILPFGILFFYQLVVLS